MENYPKTLLEFEDWFPTEEACRNYLIQLRWPEGFQCQRCNGNKAWPINRDKLYRCTKCNYETSIIAGTIFQDTKKPLRLWFRAMWYMTNQKNGASALGTQRALGIGSYHTAWKWLNKLRIAMVRPGQDRLSGIVEVDEIFLGGPRSGKRGRGAGGKTLVLIAAQGKGRYIGRIRLRQIPDASSTSLHSAIQETITPGSVVRTDGWGGYSGLDKLGFIHQISRQGEGDVGENLLPLTNRVAALLKRWLLGTHQGAPRASYLDYYLDEFTFRFNRRTSAWRGKLFYRLLQQAVEIVPIHGADIRNAQSPHKIKFERGSSA